MAVAKSYQNLEIAEGPYTVSGRQYVKVHMKNGTLKQVRFYTDAEYAKMYPNDKPAEESVKFGTQHNVLGFQKGYITIFKGDTYTNLDWFKQSIARYCRFWGWYIVSTEEVPKDLPVGIEPIQLKWEEVGKEDGSLKPDFLVEQAVNALIYDAGKSEYQGSLGDRLTLDVTVVRAHSGENGFGHYTIHTFEDTDGNQYVWSTSSKSWQVGEVKHIRGTVKDHKTFRNIKQTVLTRCMEVKM